MSVVTIPYRPRPVQKVIHKGLESHRWNVCVAHRRMGKTVMMINHLIKSALRNRLLNPRYAYVAPFYQQAKQIAWDYLKFYTAGIPGVSCNESELRVDLPNGARIKLYGADNPDAMRGLYLDGVVLDEYADMKPLIWTEVLRPTLSDREGFAVFIGTPKGLNQFYDIYQMGLYDEHWFASLHTVDDTGIISPEELASAIASGMTTSAVQQEFYCDFTASNEDVYIPLDLVQPALGRKLQKVVYYEAPKILGVDVARFGDDDSEVYKRQGLAAWHMKTMAGKDTMHLAGWIANHLARDTYDAVFVDEGGVGGGVVDRLHQLGWDVIGVNFGSKAAQQSVYKNKRAEMWGLMKQWLANGGALPNDTKFAAQISTPLYSFDESNRIVLESKKAIKKRGLKSPDKPDGLCLTFAHPVKKRVSVVEERLYNNRPSVAVMDTAHVLAKEPSIWS
jgi:hypothetical protein